jgi:5'-nucleotidase
LHFLITNDDGYEATGLCVLAAVARGYGTIDVAAPLTAQSQTSHAISMNRTVSMQELQRDDLGKVYCIHGRPADCTRLALAGVASTRRPDWVLSGINHGANLGIDVYYSGTVAAAREAAIHGVPAVSFSQFIRRPQPVDWDGAATMAGRALNVALERGCPSGTFFNINLPAVDSGFDSVPILEAPVAIESLPLSYEPTVEPTKPNPDLDGFTHYRYSGKYLHRDRHPGSDVEGAFTDNITISLVRLQV